MSCAIILRRYRYRNISGTHNVHAMWITVHDTEVTGRENYSYNYNYVEFSIICVNIVVF